MYRVLFVLGFLVACAPRMSPATPEGTVTLDRELFGMMQAEDGLTLQIRSGGCRDKSDVRLTVVGDALVMSPIEPDTCEAEIDLGENVLFPWPELPAFSKFGFTVGSVPVREPGTTPGATQAPEGAVDEAIYGVLVTRDGLDVRVFTSGCTAAEDFTSWVEPGTPQLVHLVRTKLDRCEADIPQGMLLHFTWEQLGVTEAEARLVNPIFELPLQPDGLARLAD